MMTMVKICGLRSADQALAALQAGADMLGFVFAPSRRQIDPAQVAPIAAAVRAACRANGTTIALVGVFVNELCERMAAIGDECDLDLLQLSGDEDPDVIEHLAGRRLIKTVRLDNATYELRWRKAAQDARVQILVDAHVPGSYGGAGVVADWNRAADLARQQPIILAGGLTPANVGDAIRCVRPWGVDVSSGVESAGVKDTFKIQAFIAAVRQAEPTHSIPVS